MAKNVPILSEDDDYIYAIPEAATIIGKSVKTLWSYYSDGIRKKDKQYNGRPQTFISASSIREFARRHPDKVRLDFQKIEEYTPDAFRDVIPGFQSIYNIPSEVVIPEPQKRNTMPVETKETDDRLYDFMERELQKSQEESQRINAEIQRLNDLRVDAERHHSSEVERLAKEASVAAAQLADLRGKYKILSLRYNQDVRRLREGALNPRELVLIPEITDSGDLQMPEDAEYQEAPQSSIFEAIAKVPEEIIIPETEVIHEEEDPKEEVKKNKNTRGLFKWLFGSK